ncbi:MAG: tetratricopeptide repeat protein [Deltaproteobacteria bacterium]|nr:tetratricopeptide repeat protein [Deltaproteobacteria bacterium]
MTGSRQSTVDSRQLPSRYFVTLAIVAIVWLGPAALAQTAGDIRNGARQIAARIQSSQAAGSFDEAAQKRGIEELGHLGLQFIELCDKAANSGAESRERESLLGAYEAVSDPLEDIYEKSAGDLERKAKKIMEDDGDLEALYETPAYKQGQIVGLQALYYLNWLRYYGARLHDGTARKALLEKAEKGFGELTTGEKRGELQIESMLGRGLCSLELGDLDAAAADLKAVAADAHVTEERRSKARLALLDGYVRNGNVQGALKVSDELLGQGSHSEDNLIRYFRIRALLDGAKKSSGSEAEKYRSQALALMDQLRKAGGGWEEKVAALLAASVDKPEQWANDANNPFARWELAKMLVQKNDYKQATPLLEEFVNSKDAALGRFKDEAQYFLGLARFQEGKLEEAAQRFDASLQTDKPTYGADAAYLLFKTREALAAKNPEAAKSPEYEKAVEQYVAHCPDHKFAYEGWFRLGELRHAQKRFGDAIDAYAKVKGDAAFDLRAEFGTVQSRFEILQADPKQLDVLRAPIGAGLQRFEEKAAELEKRKGATDQVPMAQMRSKVAIMEAVFDGLQTQPSPQKVADLLAGFEKKYPEQKDLLPQAVRLRTVAYQSLGRFNDAAADAKAYGALLVQTYGPKEIEDLAVAFVREGAKRNGKGDPNANQAAQQVALALYEQLPADGDGKNKKQLTLARLYENTGELPKAEQLYHEALGDKGDSLPALRGLARITESENKLPDALGYWQQLAKASRPGDAPWYEGQYQVARLTNALGKQHESCEQLEKLKPAMPGLSDVDLRGKLDELYKQVCR